MAAVGEALALERAVRSLAEARDALTDAGRDALASRTDALVELVEEELAGPVGAVLEPDHELDGLAGHYDEPYPEPEFWSRG